MIQDNAGRSFFPTQEIKKSEVQPERCVRYVRCPVCLNMMNRQNFARISGVIVDMCQGHGIWFDFGEVEKIMEFIARGGLRKAKEADLEKLRAEEDLKRIRGINNHGSPESSYALGMGTYTAAGDLSDLIGSIVSILKD
jgi:Zn-finger nucleic acid-binding protein